MNFFLGFLALYSSTVFAAECGTESPLQHAIQGVSDDVVIGMARAGRLGKCSVSIKNSSGDVVQTIYIASPDGTNLPAGVYYNSNIDLGRDLRGYVKAGVCD